MVKKICEVCGKEFEVRNYERDKRRFCSRECVDLSRRKREKRLCIWCGKEFEVVLSELKRGGGKFCSKECASKFYWSKRETRVKVMCQFCGKEFEVLYSKVRKGFGRFCSRECASLYRRKRVKKICQGCGKEFEVWQSMENAKFCSYECYKLYGRKRGKSIKVKICSGCGQKFEVEKWLVKKGFGKFCSMECYLEYLRSEEGKKHCSEISRRLWQDPEYRRKVSIGVKNCWQDPEYKERVVRSWTEAVQLMPNGLERAFCDLLQSYFLKEWKYVGDGKIFIAGFVPDFIHKEEKWIIEVNGDYWHSFPDAVERDKKKRETYEKYGYKVLEVWESEFRSDLMGVVNKIIECFYEES
jgi:very-short-patch-repair endonuclease